MFQKLSLKFVQVILVITLCIATSTSTETDGRPGCRTRYEFSRLWRHATDTESFWECTNWRQASPRQCPRQTLFHEWWQTCIPTPMWEETPYRDPPTSAYDEEDACEPIIFEPQCPLDPEPTTTTNFPTGTTIELTPPTEPETDTTPSEETSTDTTTTPNPPTESPETTTGGNPSDSTTTTEEVTTTDDPPTETPETTTGEVTTTTEATTTTEVKTTTEGATTTTEASTTTEIETTTEASTTTTTESTTEETVEGPTDDPETTTQPSTPPPTSEVTLPSTETTTKSQFQLCPGADENRMIEGSQSCLRPVCTMELYESRARLPSLDPGQYYTCLTPTVLRVNYCTTPTHCFSYALQQCVSPDQWFNPCGNV